MILSSINIDKIPDLNIDERKYVDEVFNEIAFGKTKFDKRSIEKLASSNKIFNKNIIKELIA